MSPKRKTSIYLDSRVQTRLQALAAKHGKGQSDVIQALLDFADRLPRFYRAPITPDEAQAFLETCFRNAGKTATWSDDPARLDYLVRLREAALDAGDLATAQAAQDRLDALDAPEEPQE